MTIFTYCSPSYFFNGWDPVVGSKIASFPMTLADIFRMLRNRSTVCQNCRLIAFGAAVRTMPSIWLNRHQDSSLIF